MKSLVRFFATFGYLGCLPKAPGTFGTLGAIPLVYLFSLLGPYGYMAATLLFTFFAIAICTAYEALFETHDPGEIVIDEVAGFLVTMTWLPFHWLSWVLGFLFFRALDILKPFPIGWLDKKVKGGLGVVADDLAAGILSSMLLQALLV